jgi:hypothetical protein
MNLGEEVSDFLGVRRSPFPIGKRNRLQRCAWRFRAVTWSYTPRTSDDALNRPIKRVFSDFDQCKESTSTTAVCRIVFSESMASADDADWCVHLRGGWPMRRNRQFPSINYRRLTTQRQRRITPVSLYLLLDRSEIGRRKWKCHSYRMFPFVYF